MTAWLFDMLKHYIHRAITLPPHRLIQKVVSKFKQAAHDKYKRYRDSKRPSFLYDAPQGILYSYLTKLDTGHLLLHTKTIASVTKHYLNHRFDLFGSGWVQVRHCMRCRALEEYHYDMGSPIQVDPEGKWLEGRINRANLEESKRIWKLIFCNQFKIQNSKFKIDYVPIDWHLDFKSGYRWSESAWYKDIRYGHKPGVDVKVSWELARMQHVPQLAFAYALAAQSKEYGQETAFENQKSIKGQLKSPERYALEFRNQVLDFIATNPPRFGVNWACTMDVGIRVANWLVAYNLFQAAGASFDTDFEQVFFRSVYEHGMHIINNFEYSDELTSNHYLSDIAGLLFVAAYMPRSDETDRWFKFAVQELINEMKKQVYPDGTDFEASTCYFRLVLELFFYSTLLMVRKDSGFNCGNYKEICEHIFGSEYTQKLYKMFNAVSYLLKPNGRMPQIGDNDSGQFFKLYPRDVLDMRYLPALGAVFFKESKWKIREFFESDEDISEVLILYGKNGKDIWDSLQWNSLKNIKYRSFPDAGWYVMRHKSIYCVISCGPNGQNDFGGHCHNDKLSFELNINGEDIIVDPGAYVYTPDPEARNLFRSTAYHNTVVIDGEEQNQFENWNLFLMKNDSRARCLKWESDENRDLFTGEHYGYDRLNEPVIHKREILFDKKRQTFRIKDNFQGKGRHLFEWYFHFATDIDVKLIDNKSIAANSKSGLEIIVSCNISNDDIMVELFEGWVSGSYGKKDRAKIGRYRLEKEANFEMVFEIKRL